MQHPIQHPNASAEHRALRKKLHEAELALRDQREQVSELRRQLPRDTPVDDYEFKEVRDGHVVPVRLSELFEQPDKPLILVHFMFGKAQKDPCGMCAMWADGYAALQRHLRQRFNFAAIASGDIEEFNDLARERGWNQLRILSAAGSSLNRDLSFEDDQGGQFPGVSVFERLTDGRLVHFYSVTAFAEGGRLMDLLCPVWHFQDLTPQGRGDWYPSLKY